MADNTIYQPAPAGTHIGHVHLKVADLEQVVTFYNDVMGFEVVARYGAQAAFLSAGGYHHHLATNIWNSRGAPVRSQPTTGLANVELVTDAGALESVRSRLTTGQAAQGSPTLLALRDPWGTSITLVSR